MDENKVSVGTTQPPSWVNIIDEISYELERIQSRKNVLKELQQKHLKRPDFSDEAGAKEQEKIKDLTDEVTNIFTHVRRLIRLVKLSNHFCGSSPQKNNKEKVNGLHVT